MKKPTMDRPMLASVVIGGGLFLVLISLFADPLGLGRLAGCSTYAAQRYSIAPTNIVGLRTFRGQQVNVGPFTALKPGRSEITCRAVGPIKTPDGEPFEEFIRKAFIADLSIAEVYSTAAPVTLTGRLDAIDFSSGMTDAAWDIAMTLSSSNGKSLLTDNHYSFSENFVGEVACNQTAQALMPAVQDLIGKIIAHPDFADLLR
jgi:hypothetical protein